MLSMNTMSKYEQLILFQNKQKYSACLQWRRHAVAKTISHCKLMQKITKQTLMTSRACKLAKKLRFADKLTTTMPCNNARTLHVSDASDAVPGRPLDLWHVWAIPWLLLQCQHLSLSNRPGCVAQHLQINACSIKRIVGHTHHTKENHDKIKKMISYEMLKKYITLHKSGSSIIYPQNINIGPIGLTPESIVTAIDSW